MEIQSSDPTAASLIFNAQLALKIELPDGKVVVLDASNRGVGALLFEDDDVAEYYIQGVLSHHLGMHAPIFRSLPIPRVTAQPTTEENVTAMYHKTLQ